MSLKTTEKQNNILRMSALFCGMTAEDIERALEIMDARIESFTKGEILHFPYTPMTSFGIVISGAVQACMDDVDGDRMIMAEVVPGSTFGESLCCLGVKDSPVYVCAFRQGVVIWLSAKGLLTETEDEFALMLSRRFTAMLASRTLAMNSRIQVLSKIKLRDKLVTYFSQMVRSCGSPTFTVPFSRNDFAAYIGTDRSALSRELSKMKREGLIDFDRNTFTIFPGKEMKN